MRHDPDLFVRRRRIVGVLAWICFGVCWWLVLRRDPRSWQDELLVPVVSLVSVMLITLLWVNHNLAIYRRKGARRGLPQQYRDWEEDTVGRRLDLPGAARDARVVEIAVEADVKRYFVVR